MDKTRQQIIIHEIQYWKEHKLLPESQCDFLLAIYTNGVHDGTHNVERTRWKKATLFIALYIIPIIMIPLSFVVTYFTEFSSILQIIILVFLNIYLICCYIWAMQHEEIFRHYYLVACLIITLLLTLTIADALLIDVWLRRLVTLLNFAFWFGYGTFKHITYLKFIGIMACLFVIIYSVL